jgi:SAM-dependent methyltransferase
MNNLIQTFRNEHYTSNFYDSTRNYSRQSAEVIVPLILDLLRCNEIVDVGCGDGTWLKVFQEYGVAQVLGIDGDYVDKNILQIPLANFIAFDLTKDFKLDRKFDLVISLEVAEHLPEVCANTFIDSLVKLGPFVLSAAIPSQHEPGHVNEQWQEYWAKKFYERGYVAVDFIRQKVWGDDRVAYWYSQNTLLYIDRKTLEENLTITQKIDGYRVHNYSFLSVVHPTLYLIKLGLSNFWESEKLETSNQNDLQGKRGKRILSSLVRRAKVLFNK